MQRPGRAEYLSGKHGETNWYDRGGIEVRLGCVKEQAELSSSYAGKPKSSLQASAKQQTSSLFDMPTTPIFNTTVIIIVIAHSSKQTYHVPKLIFQTCL